MKSSTSVSRCALLSVLLVLGGCGSDEHVTGANGSGGRATTHDDAGAGGAGGATSSTGGRRAADASVDGEAPAVHDASVEGGASVDGRPTDAMARAGSHVAAEYEIQEVTEADSGDLSFHCIALDNHGLVVGRAYGSSGATSAGFTWSAGAGLRFFTGLDDNVVPTDVNEHGVFTAYVNDDPYIGSSNLSGTYAALAGPAGATGFTLDGLDDSNELVGTGVYGTESRGFRMKDGVYTFLDPLPPGTQTGAEAINDNGVVVGAVELAGGAFVAARFDGTTPTALGTLGGTSSYAWDINARDHVVGRAAVSSEDQHAFFYADGQMKDLGVLEGTRSTLFAVNAQDLAVGDEKNGTLMTAIAWSAEDGMVALSTRLGSVTGWELATASGVNDRGQIVGMGRRYSRRVGFVLTPKEP